MDKKPCNIITTINFILYLDDCKVHVTSESTSKFSLCRFDADPCIRSVVVTEQLLLIHFAVIRFSCTHKEIL